MVHVYYYTGMYFKRIAVKNKIFEYVRTAGLRHLAELANFPKRRDRPASQIAPHSPPLSGLPLPLPRTTSSHPCYEHIAYDMINISSADRS